MGFWVLYLRWWLKDTNFKMIIAISNLHCTFNKIITKNKEPKRSEIWVHWIYNQPWPKLVKQWGFEFTWFHLLRVSSNARKTAHRTSQRDLGREQLRVQERKKRKGLLKYEWFSYGYFCYNILFSHMTQWKTCLVLTFK